MPDYLLHEISEWKDDAAEQQRRCYETYGNRELWRGRPISDQIIELQMRLASVVYGPPPITGQHNVENAGYRHTQVHRVHHLASKIAQHFQDFVVTIKVLYVCHNLRSESQVRPVFRVLTDSRELFMDTSYRMYISWDAYLTENDLPECYLCYPPRPHYELAGNGEDLLLAFSSTPSTRFTSRLVNMMDALVLLVALVGVIVSVGSKNVPGI
ncbi:hypothetical protein B566_EDAN004544, partial [Ephemera danica]